MVQSRLIASWIIYILMLLKCDPTFSQNFEYVGFGGSFNNVDLNGNNAIAVGDGVILYSQDKGKTWLLASFPTSSSIILHDVHMATPLVGWAVGANGAILKTRDGGQTWIKQSAPLVAENSVLRGVHAVDENIIYAVGESTTTSSGLTPIQRGGIGSITAGSPYPRNSTVVPIPDGTYTNRTILSTPSVTGITTATATVQVTGGVFTSITITSPGSGFTLGQQVYIARNQFPGSTATTASVSPLFTVSGLAASMPSAYINNHIILKSTDGGATWVSLLDNVLPTGLSHMSTGQFYDVKFVDQNVGYVVGRSGSNTFDGGGGKILKTIDGGNSWTVTTLYDDINRLISAPTTNLATVTFSSLALFDPNIVYVGGSARLLYKSVDAGANWTLMQSSLKSIPGISGINHVWGNIYGAHPDSLIIANQSSIVTTDYSSIISDNGGVSFTRKRVPNGFVGPNQLAGEGSCVILVGSGGQISLSTDKGVNFTPIMEPRVRGTQGIFFPSKLVGYAFGEDGLVYKTIDGGLNWFNPIVGGGAAGNITTTFQAAWFFNDTKGILVANESFGSKLVSTNDGGATWIDETAKVANANLFDIFFSTPLVGWAVGNSTTTSVVYKTNDGGISWSLVSNLPFAAAIFDQAKTVYFVDALTGYIGGSGGRLFKTIDGGTTWTNLDLSNDFTGGSFTINDVWFADANKGYVAGSNGIFAQTNNGGLTWDSTAIFNPTTGLREIAIINKMEWLDANEGYLVGTNGFHYYTRDGGLTFTRFTPITSTAFSVATNPSWPYKATAPLLPCNLYVAYNSGIIGTKGEKYYPDQDNDGLGDGTQPFDISFVPINGYVTNDRDCDDTDPEIQSIPQGVMTCHNKLNISLDSSCNKRIRPEMLLINQVACLSNFQVSIEGQASDVVPTAGKYTVTVKDLISGNSCWGEINVEDKLRPIIKCVDTIKVSCMAVPTESAILPTVVECSGYTLHKTISIGKDICGIKETIISYTATDKNGLQSSPCRQVIIPTPITFDSIKLPVSNVVVPACINDLLPQEIASIMGDTFAYPTILNNGVYTSITGSFVCNVFTNYKDVEYDLCGDECKGAKKIVRTWSLTDWCTNRKTEYTQIIKAVDIQAPTFSPINITSNANLWKCDGEFTITKPTDLVDNCDSNPTWFLTAPQGIIVTGNSITGYKLSGLKKGINTFFIIAEDCCGNSDTKQGSITLLDNTAPVVILKEKLVLSLITDVTEVGNNKGEGKIFAKDVDNGSYDNCGPIKIEIRRPLGAPSCDNIGTSSRNNNVTFNNNGTGNDVTTWAHPDDHNNDTDNGEFIKFCCEDLNEEYQQVIIRVWDDGNMNGVAGDNLIINGRIDNYSESWADVKVELKQKPRLKCPENIVVPCNETLDISTVLKTVTNIDIPAGKATMDIDCGGIALRYIDDINENTCGISSVERTFLGINRGDTSRCTQSIVLHYNPTLEITQMDTLPVRIPQCNLSKDDFLINGSMNSFKPKVTSHRCDVIGENIEVQEYEIENGVCKKWEVTFNYINWCSGKTATAKSYYYFRDTILPIIISTNQMIEANSSNGNCQAALILSAYGTDANQCTNDGWLKWQLAVDLNTDGGIDYTYGSDYPANHQRYVKPSASGETILVNLLPITNSDKTHSVYWAAQDGCGNTARDTSTFMVIDKKAPTPYCINLSTAYMKNCTIELWAKDFDRGAYDNCTPANELLFTFNNAQPVMSKILEEHFFKGQGIEATLAEYNQGDAQKWLPSARTSGKQFDADDYQDSMLTITVWDKNLNHDFCNVRLNIIDNQGGCLINLKGEITTRSGAVINPLEVKINAENTGYSNQFITNGLFNMPNMTNDNYAVIASKNDDFTKGVSTLDLVTIQRHILGLQKIEDDYSLLAADINGDAKINTTDIVELRKLILGLANRFTNQDSWKFLPKNYVFGGANPDAIKNGVVVKADNLDKTAKLVGIKIGDVNQDIKMNEATATIVQPRSRKVLHLTNDLLKNGETFEVNIKTNEALLFLGLQSQFDVTFEVLAVTSDMQNIAFNQKNNLLKISIADGRNNIIGEKEILYTIHGRARQSGYLSEMLAINETNLLSEIYSDGNTVYPLNYRFSDVSSKLISLSQNEPNPFAEATMIDLTLPSDMPFEFTIIDATSKVLLKRYLDGKRGDNKILVKRDELNVSSGVLFYQIKTGEQTITKKMVMTN